MATRERLETDISNLQDQINNASEDTPKDIMDMWEQQLVDLSFELNNMVDTDDNNE